MGPNRAPRGLQFNLKREAHHGKSACRVKFARDVRPDRATRGSQFNLKREAQRGKDVCRLKLERDMRPGRATRALKSDLSDPARLPPSFRTFFIPEGLAKRLRFRANDRRSKKRVENQKTLQKKSHLFSSTLLLESRSGTWWAFIAAG